jgi:glucose/arabinose dehydrogenase
MRPFALAALLLISGSTYSACALSKPAAAASEKFRVENLAQREGSIWSFDFLPDGRILFTERSGAFFAYDPRTKKVEPVSGAPKVFAEGQGGLLDVKLHPEFKKNSFVYFSYAEPLDGGQATTALGRGRLEGNELKNVERLFSAKAVSKNDIHFGSRIVFDGPDTLYLTVSERNERDKAQDPQVHNGKLLRLTAEGKPHAGNAYGEGQGLPEIYTLGHRSVQGLALRENGELWEIEMGPRGGDEVNFIRKGVNYGWPVITYGREYYGPKIGEKAKDGLEQPVAYWVPSISPSGAEFYRGDKFRAWKGSLFLACLSGQQLRRLELDGRKVVRQEALLEDLEKRFRMVRSGPDGYLYFSTDDGLLARLVPGA